MAHLTPVPDPVADDTASEAKPPAEAKPRRSGPPLPSDRITFPRQLEILRAFAVAAADGSGVASSEAAGERISMSHNTIAIITPFFVNVGLLHRADRGRFSPSEEVIEYSRAIQWSPTSATHRLAPLIRKSWFGLIIDRMVSVQARNVDEVLTDLAGAAGAEPKDRPQIELLIEYAAAAGLVQREGRTIRQAHPGLAQAEAASAPDANPAAPPVERRDDTQALGVRTNFRRDETENVVSFDISVRVRMSEFAGWRPERISAFFGGIASVLAAKGRMEEDAGGS